MQPHPRAECAQIAGQINDRRFAVAVLDIGAKGGSVLADHQQFPHAILNQLFSLSQHRTRRA